MQKGAKQSAAQLGPKDRAEARLERRRYTGVKAAPADWGKVDSHALQDAIRAASEAGGALRFGYTRDLGAYAVGVYGLEAEAYTEYLRPSDDVEQFLGWLVGQFDQAAKQASAAKTLRLPGID